MAFEDPKPLPGRQIFGHYVIERKLGEGAFGIVYMGRDMRLGRPVAVKLLRANPGDERGWIVLLEEARTASALSHPNICAIYDVGEESGQGFIVMEYIEGRTLQELVASGQLNAEAALRWGAEVTAALAHAHRRGIVHRDLKASNVMITSEGQAKLLDFGLAARLAGEEFETVKRSRKSLNEIGGWAGTLPYIAPEVLHGKPGGVPSDLWALGALLYELLTGSLPFRGDTPFELSMSIMADPTPALPPGTPRGIQATICRCLEKDPARRYHDASEVLEDLRREQSLIQAGRPRSWYSRRRWIAVATSLVVVVGFAAALEFHERRWRPTILHSAPVVAMPSPPTPTGSAVAKPVARHSLEISHHSQPRKKTQGNPFVKVWVNSASDVYHCPGSRWYRNTEGGELLTQRLAEEKGFRPAHERFCR